MSDDQKVSTTSDNIDIKEESQQSSRNNHRLFPVNAYREANKSLKLKHVQSNQKSDGQSIR